MAPARPAPRVPGATAALVAALVAALAGGGSTAQPVGLGAAEVAGVLDDLADCAATSGDALVLAVAGVPPDQTALAEAEAEALRLDVEGALAATGRVRLAPAGDVNRLRALREGSTGLPAAEAEALIARAHQGDAVIFVVAPERREASVAFRLQAVTPDGACKVTSPALEAPLAPGGSASPDRVIGAALDALDEAAPGLPALAVCPVVAEGGHSACAGALTDRVVALAAARAASPERVLAERPLAVSRAGPAECAGPGEGARVAGRLGADEESAGWLDLEVRDGARVIAALPRTRIDLGALGCDPTSRPFLDHVAATARADRAVLDMVAPPFPQGARLEIEMELGAARPLYCWVLAPDETAFVALPVAADAVVGPGPLAYPASFGLPDVLLEGAWENLFHCFALAEPPPPALDERWRAVGPTGAAALLGRDEIMDLLATMRALPGVAEATARIVVR